MKTTLLVILVSSLTALAQPTPSVVTLQNATTNLIKLDGTDYSGDAFSLHLSPGQTVKQVFTGATFTFGTDAIWRQAQPTNGMDLQVLVCGPVTAWGPTFLSAVTPALVPDSASIVEFWIWGVCTALALGLAGALRRMLGRVHEINTDL
ncbi:MAG TPA: hypothetical protein VFC07_09850 [Verrucomicrobiae bacterium]|nr:hypothetical protein [Verrucomicrobiae bacterium]